MSAGSPALASLVRAPPGGPHSGAHPEEPGELDLGTAAMAALVAHLRRFSPFLGGIVTARPDLLARLAAEPAGSALERIVANQSGIAARVSGQTLDIAGARRELRRNRAELSLLVALADLGGVWSLQEVTAALSDFADASVRSAVGVALGEAAAAGFLDPAAIGPAAEGSGLMVLALGKHGAGELNYSSDIDLIVFYDPEAPALRPDATPSRGYNRIAQSVVKLLSERTPDGYVHRVDYRLRPDPGSTPAAVSLPAAYTYYETVGQNWERAAMIKARPVAGDLALGGRFLKDLQPFVWRKYFDFAAIADIHAMKRQIHAVRGHGEIAVAGHDIKLGRGGIREVEFFVQTQQLVFGGRRPALRGIRTLEMLPELERDGWISGAAREEMSAAYVFLRTIEHRLQMVADEQTQRLPLSEPDLASFAAFAGYEGVEAIAADLTGHARRVQSHYRFLFREGPELALEAGSLVFTGTGDDPATLATLARLGFREAARAAETIRGWHFGRRPAVTSARAREVLTELVPPLLEALGGTADPDGALAKLDQAFARMPAAVELMTILLSHRSLLVLFADLLGTAPRLADTVAAAPHVLDAVIDPGFVDPVRDEAGIEADLRSLVRRPADFEEFLDRLREAAHQLQFVTGARMLSGILSPEGAGAAFAAIARAAVRAALDEVSAVFAADHGIVPGGEVVVLGLGRLGAGDLTATSDLDLVLVYDFDTGSRSSDGRRPLDAVVYYTRLTQRLIAALTAPTRRGRLFDVDMRLRPSGTKGPVASQFSGFKAYHGGEADLWEHMALTRARVLAGPSSLVGAFAGRVDASIREVLTRRRDRHEVFGAVASMRDLVWREKGEGVSGDLKLARGGLLELDFMAQAVVLAHAADRPDLIGGSTGFVLAEAGRSGLLPADEARILAAAYRSLDDVLHWQRLTVGSDGVTPEAGTALRKRLAAMLGAPDPGALEQQLAEIRRPVAEIFDRWPRGPQA